VRDVQTLGFVALPSLSATGTTAALHDNLAEWFIVDINAAPTTDPAGKITGVRTRCHAVDG